MAHSQPAPTLPTSRWRRYALRLVLGTFYLVALSSLIVWEYRDHIDVLSSGCESTPAASESSFYSHPYRQMLNWTRRGGATQVSVVVIPAGLQDVTWNVCEARAYVADLLRVIADQHPGEIVIDKFYGPSACRLTPEDTVDLLAVVRSISVPVVVGESTDIPDSSNDNSCLVRKPQLDFNSPNVHRGLTRLNVESEKIPLEWPVLPSAGATHAQMADSLSWAAVKAYDPAYAERPRLQNLIDTRRHPFANLDIDLPHETSTSLLCTAGTPEMRKRWSPDCSGTAKPISLLGRVVVIGAESSTDEWAMPGGRARGFDLQASYIQVLLSGSYLRALPFWIAFGVFALFVFLIEGLPTILEIFRPRWKKRKFLSLAYREQRYAWVIVWALVCILLPTLLCLLVGYLPPLLVFGDILFVAITRLLFFFAESTQVPLHHAHRKGAL